MKDGDITLKMITIRIKDEEKDAILDFARQYDLTISQVVRRAIKYYFLSEEDIEDLLDIPE